jgi:hypothetical protein
MPTSNTLLHETERLQPLQPVKQVLESPDVVWNYGYPIRRNGSYNYSVNGAEFVPDPIIPVASPGGSFSIQMPNCVSPYQL